MASKGIYSTVMFYVILLFYQDMKLSFTFLNGVVNIFFRARIKRGILHKKSIIPNRV